MSRTAAIGLHFTVMTLGAARAPARARGEPGGEALEVVVQVNAPETGRQGHVPRNVAGILKEAPDTRVEDVDHRAGIGLVERARNANAEAVERPLKKGVRFVACEDTMRQKSIREEQPPGVGTIPSVALEVVRSPQKIEYADFKP